MNFVGKSLIGARWISFCLGAAGVIFVILTCRRKGGILAAVIGGSLLTFTPNLIADLCSVKTQALTFFLTAASIFLITDTDNRICKILLSVCAMNLAVLARLSMLPALLILWGFVLYRHKNEIRRYLLIIAVNLLFLFFVFMYFYSNGNFLFGIYNFHHEYYYYTNVPACLDIFSYFIITWLSNQFSILICFLAAISLFIYSQAVPFIKKNKHLPVDYDIPYLLLIFICYVMTTLLHSVRYVKYPVHQTSNIAFIVIFTAIVLGRGILLFKKTYIFLFIAAYLTLIFLTIFYQKNMINWNGDGSPGRMLVAARLIKQLAKEKSKLITFNVELAVESNSALLQGYEFGEYSYFSGMPDERAKKLNVVNRHRLLRDLAERRADIVCFTSGNIVNLGSNNMQEWLRLIADNYKVKYIVTGYGQFLQDLFIMKARA